MKRPLLRKFDEPLYICDPKKNNTCRGIAMGNCGSICFCTKDPKLSSDPFHPIINNYQFHEAELKVKRELRGIR